MRYFILSGSHRVNSESRRVAEYFKNQISKIFPDDSTHVFSLEKNPIPLWDESIWEGSEDWKKLWTPIKNELNSADAIIVVSPEWAGMVTPGVKNFLLLAGGGSISHKPGLIVSVSAARNGAYPVSELRMSGTKNNQLCYIPEHIIVRDCAQQLKGDETKSEDDKYLRARIDYSIKLLREYAKALNLVRSSGVVDGKNYPYGM